MYGGHTLQVPAVWWWRVCVCVGGGWGGGWGGGLHGRAGCRTGAASAGCSCRHRRSRRIHSDLQGKAAKRRCSSAATACPPPHVAHAGAAHRLHDSAAGAGGRRVAARISAGPGGCQPGEPACLAAPLWQSCAGSSCGRRACWDPGRWGICCACAAPHSWRDPRRVAGGCPSLHTTPPLPPLDLTAQVRDAGNLLTRAGLTIPAVDVDEIQARRRRRQRSHLTAPPGGTAPACCLPVERWRMRGPVEQPVCQAHTHYGQAPCCTQVHYRDAVQLVEHLRWAGGSAFLQLATSRVCVQPRG